MTSTNKTASLKVFVVCGWREEAVAGVCLRTYLVHSTYVFLVIYEGYESWKNCKPSCSSSDTAHRRDRRAAFQGEIHGLSTTK